MSSHFKKPPAGVPEDRKVYDDNGRLLGWFAVGGPAKTGFEAKGFRTKEEARIACEDVTLPNESWYRRRDVVGPA